VKAEQRDREKEKNKLNNVAILSVEGGKRNSCYFVYKTTDSANLSGEEFQVHAKALLTGYYFCCAASS